jgi:hypothetical protein
MKNLLSKLNELFESWCEGTSQKALESYLSKSQNIADLETRMKNWQHSNTNKNNFLPH